MARKKRRFEQLEAAASAPKDKKTYVDPFQAQLINKMRRGSLLVPGQTLLIMEVEPAAYITLAANGGNGSGTVAIAPAGASCGVNCYEYDYGTAVMITGTANTGSTFMIAELPTTPRPLAIITLSGRFLAPVAQTFIDSAQATARSLGKQR